MVKTVNFMLRVFCHNEEKNWVKKCYGMQLFLWRIGSGKEKKRIDRRREGIFPVCLCIGPGHTQAGSASLITCRTKTTNIYYRTLSRWGSKSFCIRLLHFITSLWGRDHLRALMARGHGHLPSITQLGREGPWIQMQAVGLLGLCSQPLHCRNKPDPEALSTHQSHPAKQWDSNPALSSSGLLPPLSPGAADTNGKLKKEELEGGQEPHRVGSCGPRFHSWEKRGSNQTSCRAFLALDVWVYGPELEAEGPRRPLLCAAASYHWGGSSEVCRRADPDAARSTCSRKARSQGLWDAALHSCPGNIKGHKQKG